MISETLAAVLCCALIGYFIGSISPSFLVGKLKGYDVRQAGSKNAGASNTIIMAGKLAGVIVALVDILKASVSWWISAALFPTLETAGIIGGTACIIGHIFPLFLHFRGGKGLACLGGVIIAYSPKSFLLMLAIAVLLAALTNYVAIVTVTMSAVWPLYYGITTAFWLGAAILALPFVPIFAKHMENFRRISMGAELRLSFLWNKSGELIRTGHEDEM